MCARGPPPDELELCGPSPKPTTARSRQTRNTLLLELQSNNNVNTDIMDDHCSAIMPQDDRIVLRQRRKRQRQQRLQRQQSYVCPYCTHEPFRSVQGFRPHVMKTHGRYVTWGGRIVETAVSTAASSRPRPPSHPDSTPPLAAVSLAGVIYEDISLAASPSICGSQSVAPVNETGSYQVRNITADIHLEAEGHPEDDATDRTNSDRRRPSRCAVGGELFAAACDTSIDLEFLDRIWKACQPSSADVAFTGIDPPAPVTASVADIRCGPVESSHIPGGEEVFAEMPFFEAEGFEIMDVTAPGNGVTPTSVVGGQEEVQSGLPLGSTAINIISSGSAPVVADNGISTPLTLQDIVRTVVSLVGRAPTCETSTSTAVATVSQGIQSTAPTHSVASQTPIGQFGLPTGVSIELLTHHFCSQPSASVEALLADVSGKLSTPPTEQQLHAMDLVFQGMDSVTRHLLDWYLPRRRVVNDLYHTDMQQAAVLASDINRCLGAFTRRPGTVGRRLQLPPAPSTRTPEAVSITPPPFAARDSVPSSTSTPTTNRRNIARRGRRRGTTRSSRTELL